MTKLLAKPTGGSVVGIQTQMSQIPITMDRGMDDVNSTETHQDINMEVDDLSMSLPTETTSSNHKGTEYWLPEDQLRKLTSKMHRASTGEYWPSRLNDTSKVPDPKELWRSLCISVFQVLTAALDDTDLNRNVLTNLQYDYVCQLIDGCDEKERDDMRNGVRKGIAEGNWATLIEHRRYHF
jgi:hypothetical protein